MRNGNAASAGRVQTGKNPRLADWVQQMATGWPGEAGVLAVHRRSTQDRSQAWPGWAILDGVMITSTSTGRLSEMLRLAAQGLRSWTARQAAAAGLVAVLMALVIGLATVLIPNPVFGRDIPPVWWNYPVWILTSVLAGMLVATYVRPTKPGPNDGGFTIGLNARQNKRSSRFGVVGGALAWFAVGCPVCNKIALIALGYAGALTWFAPFQPFLAAGSVVLLAVALVVRLRGQAACPLPRQRRTPVPA